MIQLVHCVPRLKGAKSIHLSEGAVQTNEGAEYSEPCFESTIMELMVMNYIGMIDVSKGIKGLRRMMRLACLQFEALAVEVWRREAWCIMNFVVVFL